jgi:hypothetical protein
VIGLHQSQSLELRQAQILELPYDRVGDVELFSLHRIKGRIKTLDVHPLTRGKLVRRLLEENSDYRERHHCRKFCVTFGGLETSFEDTIEYLREQAKLGLTTVDNSGLREILGARIRELIDAQGVKIRQWFEDNYDELIYDQSAQIPFPIIVQMRKRFSAWALGNIGISSESIYPLIEKAAREVGINPDTYLSYEALWEDLRDYKQ